MFQWKENHSNHNIQPHFNIISRGDSMCKKIQTVDDFIDDDDYNEESDYPCDSCDNWCDGWEARYCCTLCMWYDDDPDCDSCDSWDI